MKNKYFRFLYCVTKSCFIHFGEVKDTMTGENLTFVYLKGTENEMVQEGTEAQFLYPDYVDYAVLGQADAQVRTALEDLLERTRVGTLVVPVKEQDCFPKQMEGVNEIVWLGNVEEMYGRQVQGANGKNETFASCLDQISAGWKLSVRCLKEGTLSMMHMHEQERVSQNESSEQQGIYDDCVMNVKTMDADKRCMRESQPDEFGCALGCVLHQDYDVCKYRDKENMGYLTGTLLLGGTEDAKSLKKMMKDKDWECIRFFAAEDLKEEELKLLLGEEGKGGPKRYYIGTKTGDEAVIKICESGTNRVPVVLKEGYGICCAGLMRYVQEK